MSDMEQKPHRHPMLEPKQIARVCHEANRGLTAITKDVPVQGSWEEIDEDMRRSCVNGVVFNLKNPELPASASHDNWMKERLDAGWTLGPVKDPEKKTHPALVPYAELPAHVQLKDAVFKAIVRALSVAPLLLALFAASAFAADVAAPAAPSSSPVLEAVLQYVVAPLIALLAPLLVAALAKLVTYLHSKEKESKIALVGAVVADAASSVVAELNATLKPKLQAALADGKLTDVEKAELKEAALSALKTKLPAGILGGAQAIFGPLVDQWMGGLIERSVLAQKPPDAPAAAPAVPPMPLGG